MSRRFQFSLGRLFFVVVAMSVAATFAGKMGRLDDSKADEVVFLWLGITIGAVMSAGGILLHGRPVRGAIIGLALGFSVVLPFILGALLLRAF